MNRNAGAVLCFVISHLLLAKTKKGPRNIPLFGMFRGPFICCWYAVVALVALHGLLLAACGGFTLLQGLGAVLGYGVLTGADTGLDLCVPYYRFLCLL